jgi:hypothetical protein
LLELIEVKMLQCYNTKTILPGGSSIPFLWSYCSKTANAMATIEQIEAQLWETADQLRATPKLTIEDSLPPVTCCCRS